MGRVKERLSLKLARRVSNRAKRDKMREKNAYQNLSAADHRLFARLGFIADTQPIVPRIKSGEKQKGRLAGSGVASLSFQPLGPHGACQAGF